MLILADFVHRHGSKIHVNVLKLVTDEMLLAEMHKPCDTLMLAATNNTVQVQIRSHFSLPDDQPYFNSFNFNFRKFFLNLTLSISFI